MKKKLNTTAITNELHGSSAFFPSTDANRPSQTPTKEAVLFDKQATDHHKTNTSVPQPIQHQESMMTENKVGMFTATHQPTKVVNHQPILPPTHQVTLPPKQQPTKLASKQLRKITSYLTEDSFRAMKRIAFESERSDYEILQEALNEYLQHHNKE